MASGLHGRRPTIGDVARLAGVSEATVSRVLNADAGKRSAVTEAKRARVAEAICELDFRPSRAGQTLRTQVATVVALLIPDATNAFYGAIAHSTETALRERGYAMILCNTDEDPELQDFYLREMQAHLVAAIVLLGAVDTVELRRVAEGTTPVVFLNRRAPEGVAGPFVGIDNYQAGRDVGAYFAERGWERVACIHGPLSSSASRTRYQGFLDALLEASVSVGPDRRIPGDLTIESGYGGMTRLLEQDDPPEAVFCGNDLMAYGAARHLGERGLSVHDDIALFGFDDNPLNAWLAPWLSTVRVPHEQFGAAAAEVVVRRAANDEEARAAAPEVLLPYELEIRASA